MYGQSFSSVKETLLLLANLSRSNRNIAPRPPQAEEGEGAEGAPSPSDTLSPMAEHDVLVAVDPKFGIRIGADWLVGVARITLELERVPSCQLSVVLTGDEEVRQLNRQYAGDDHATDVLSFSLREGEEFVSPDTTDRLGEIIVSFETATRQAAEANHELEDEIAHLVVHGVLHLLGFDHLEPEDETKMRMHEHRVLSELGYEMHAHG